MHRPETGTPMDLRVLCESMKSNAKEITDAILGHWDVIGSAEPWHRLPDDLGHDHLPDLIRDLAGAALCTEFDREMCAELVSTAAEHGRHRAEEGMDAVLIYREYHLLRRALWEVMKEDHGESATLFYATMRVDAVSGLATAAALHGLNNTTLEEQGRWPNVLDELLDDWPLPS